MLGLPSDKYRNLRGGVVYATADVIVATARAWILKNGFDVGRCREGGRPVYDLADGARFLLMRRLISEWGMRSQIAADTVNASYAKISFHAEDLLMCLDDGGRTLRSEHFLMLIAKPGTLRPEFVTKADYLVRSAFRDMEMVVDLKALVSSARERIDNIHANQVSFEIARDEFATA